MGLFMDMGQNILNAGGVFDFKLGSDGRISDVFVLKASMIPYTRLYNDFVINDGSHNMDMYGTITMPNTIVDCLGNSVIAAYSQYWSEYSGHLVQALTKFGLRSPGSTLMTDDSPAYHIVAQELKMTHLLCVKYYQDSIFSSRTGLGLLAADFNTQADRAIFFDFRSPTALSRHLTDCVRKFGHDPAACRFSGWLLLRLAPCMSHTYNVCLHSWCSEYATR